MLELDPGTVAAVITTLGLGTILKSFVDSWIGRKRSKVDLTKMSIDITTSVMGSMRSELADTRQQLTETRVMLDRAHAEIAELRDALTHALRELATYRTTSTTTTVSTSPVMPGVGIHPPFTDPR